MEIFFYVPIFTHIPEAHSDLKDGSLLTQYFDWRAAQHIVKALTRQHDGSDIRTSFVILFPFCYRMF